MPGVFSPNTTAASTTVLGQIAAVGTDIADASIAVAVGTIGGASAGENIGGDMATSALGPIAQPFGQAIGRNVGTVVGGAAGAAVIRCSSRRRSSSAVRFAPEV